MADEKGNGIPAAEPGTEPTQKKLSKKEALRQRLEKAHEGMDFDDEEVYAGRINDDYDEYENRIAKYQQDEKTLSDLITRDPRAAEFLSRWTKGEDPLIEFAREYGDDFSEAMQNPEMLDKLAEARADHMKRVAEENKLEEEWKQNMLDSFERLDAYAEKNGMDDDQKNELFEQVQSLYDSLTMGRYTDDLFDFVRKAMSHDVDVETAKREGVVSGRNENIKAKLRHAKKGDGTAGGGDGGASVTPKDDKRQRRDHLFELASMAQ